MKLKKQDISLLIIVQTVIVLTFLNSCTNRVANDRKVFYYNEPTGIASLDPAFAKNQSIIWAVHQIYNTLVETDDALNMVPGLASRWEVSADRLTYLFHLRSDVFFHDNDAFEEGKGRKFTAYDVEYSLKRIIDPATASSGAWIFNDRIDRLQGFKAINDSTFQLKLLQPFNPILGLLSMQYCSIVPREVVQKYGKDFRSHPCGTGPFRLVAWEEGQAMIMAKNDRYFERDSLGNALPYLDGIKISFFDNKATEFLLFRQKKLDFMNDIDPSFKDEVLNKKGELKKEWNDKMVLAKHPYLNTEYLGILVDTASPVVKNSPLRLRKIRQAINYGFDRRKMMLYLRNSIGIPAESGFIPPGFPSFNADSVKGYRYNPELARQLISEVGFGPKNPLPVIKLITVPVYADMGSFIARELQELGIPVQVEVVQKSLLLEQTAKSEALFFRGSWMADYPDAENYLSVFYSKNPAPPNYTRYHNPAFDRLYQQCLTEKDDLLKYKLYQEMDNLIIQDAPVVPLWYDEIIRFMQPTIRGFTPNGLNLLELRRTKKL